MQQARTTRPARVTLGGIIEQVIAETDLPAAHVEAAVKSALDAVIRNLAEDRRVTLTGFGSFVPHLVAPRAVRDPRTGERRELGPRIRIRFAAGKRLRDGAEEVLTAALENGSSRENVIVLVDGEQEDGDRAAVESRDPSPATALPARP